MAAESSRRPAEGVPGERAPLLLALENSQPQVATDAWLAPHAIVIGAVLIGPLSSIWYGAILRADSDPIRIGARTNVQDGCILHADPGFPITIGDDVSIGHGAIVHGAEIGDGSLIGMGARVLNGAVLGRQCLVAAGTLVPEGFVAPDLSVIIGTPGTVRREIREPDRALLAETAEEYVALARTHREQLRLITKENRP